MQVKAPRTHWEVEARTPTGELLWKEEFSNLVTNQGIDDLLQQYFKGVNYSASWYIGLVNSGAIFSAIDTMSLHTGWTENTGYTANNRQQALFGQVSSRATDNTGNKAVFVMSAPADISGVFLCTGGDKGGTSGILYAVANFSSGPHSLAADAVLTIAVTVTGA